MTKPGPAAVAVVAAALALPGCASAPKAQPELVLGRTVTLFLTEGESKLSGELLAVDQGTLWLRAADGIRTVPLAQVREARVKRHGLGRKKAWLWTAAGALITGGGLATSCASVEGSEGCGAYGAVSAGIWLLAGGLAAESLESSSHYRVPNPTAETLRSYARLPQGLPAGVPPTALGPPPPASAKR